MAGSSLLQLSGEEGIARLIKEMTLNLDLDILF